MKTRKLLPKHNKDNLQHFTNTWRSFLNATSIGNTQIKFFEVVVEYEINASYNGYSSSLKVNFPWILVVFHNLEAYLN